MAEAEAAPDEAPKKKSKLPLLIGIVLMLVLGGGGFYATFSGMILGGGEEVADDHAPEDAANVPDIAFVPIDPLIVSLGTSGRARHLRFSSQLEVSKAHQEEVTMLMPRILDVLNGYLRAVEVAELEDPSALIRLRAQMLRRVQIVSGEGRVRDLLVTEFVLN
jgi:flagellar protein FliL